MQLFKCLLLLIGTFGLPSFLFSQDALQIRSSNNGQPLVGVHLQIGENVLVSDGQGYFALTDTLLKEVEATLSHQGFESKTLALPTKANVIWMFPSEIQLSEVAVRAYESSSNEMQLPASITVLSPQKLQADDGLDLPSVLNRVPGVHWQSGALNTNRLTIRGIGTRSQFSTSKIKAYVGEIPITNGEGITTLENWEMAFLGQTEVIRGPSSSVYGTSLGGTVLFQPGTARGEGNQFRICQQGGSFGTWRSLFDASLKQPSSVQRMVASYSRSNGYRQNSELERFNLAGWGTWFTEKGNSWTALANVVAFDAHIPSSLSAENYLPRPEVAAQNWLSVRGYERYFQQTLGITYEHHFNTKSVWKNTLFSHLNNGEEFRPWDLLEERSLQIGLRSVYQYATTWKGFQVKGLLGFEGSAETVSTSNRDHEEGNLLDLLDEARQRRTGGNLFSQLNLESEKWQVQLGMNGNVTAYRYTDQFLSDSDNSQDYRYDPIFSPRVAVSYRATPTHTFFAQMSHGFSPPTVEETLPPEADQATNTQIVPERGRNFEAGYRYFDPENRWFFELIGYRMVALDLLVSERITEERTLGRNAGKTLHQGLETRLEINWLRQEGWQWQQTFSASFFDHTFEDFRDDGADFSGNDLTGVPQQQLSVENQLSFRKATLNLQGLHMGEIPLRDDNSTRYAGHWVWHARIDKSWSVKDVQLRGFGGVRNLFNAHYASMVLVNASSFGGRPPRYFYPGWERNFYLGAALAW